MKSKLAVFALGLVLASCTQIITIEPPPPNVRVYNSAWQIVRADRLEARSITSTASLEAYVADYNAANTDDQLFLIEGEAEVPITQAPSANAWIVDATTYEIKEEYLGVARIDLETDRELWRLQTRNVGNALLFVDRIPPRPAPPPEITDYERFAIYYILKADGSILAETHCEDWEEAGYASRQACFESLLAIWSRQVYADGGTTQIIHGRLYP